MTVAELIEALTELDKPDALVVIADQTHVDMVLSAEYDRGVVIINHERDED